MATTPDEETPGGPNSPWPGFVKFLLIVLFALMCFWLATSMKHYHFFDGGRYNNQEPRR